MDTKKENPVKSNDVSDQIYGSGSVAQQIIGEFLSTLSNVEEHSEIAQKLKVAIFDGKPTEAMLREAMFGEKPL